MTIQFCSHRTLISSLLEVLFQRFNVVTYLLFHYPGQDAAKRTLASRLPSPCTISDTRCVEGLGHLLVAFSPLRLFRGLTTMSL